MYLTKAVEAGRQVGRLAVWDAASAKFLPTIDLGDYMMAAAIVGVSPKDEAIIFDGEKLTAFAFGKDGYGSMRVIEEVFVPGISEVEGGQ